MLYWMEGRMRTGDGSEGLSMSGVEYSNRGENITCVSAICKDYFLMDEAKMEEALV